MPGYTTKSLLSNATLTAALASRAASPEPPATTANGTIRGQAAFDTPPPDAQPEDLPRSSRTRTHTKRAQAGYLQERAESRQRSTRNRNTRARNQSANQSYTALRKAQRHRHGPDDRATAPRSITPGSEVEDQGLPPSKSPSPTYVAPQPAEQPRLHREHIALEIEQRFRDAMEDHTTQELEGVLDVIRDDPAYATRSAQQGTEVSNSLARQRPHVLARYQTRVISSTQIGVGGGFHLDHTAHGSGLGGSTRAQQTRAQRSPPTPPPTALMRSNSASQLDTQMTPPGLPTPRVTTTQPIRYIPPPPVLDEDSPFIENPPAPVAPDPQPPRPDLDQNDEGSRGDANHTRAALNALPIRHERSSTHVSETPPVRSPRTHAPPAPIPLLPAADDARVLPPTSQQAPSAPATQQSRGHATTAPQSNGSIPRSSYNSRSFDMRSINLHRPPPELPRTNGPTRRARGSSRRSPSPYPTKSAPQAPSRPISSRSSARPPAGSRLRAHSSSTRQHNPFSRVQPSSNHRSAERSDTRQSRLADMHATSGDEGEDDDDDEDMIEGFDEDENIAGAAKANVYIDNKPSKPSTRDLTGRDRTIWRPARDLTFGVSIGLGHFTSYRVWDDIFEDVHFRLFTDMYRGRQYERPGWILRTVCRNSVSSCRYHNADRLRAVIKTSCGFEDPSTEAIRTANEAKYIESWPNAFHCLNRAQRTGHYEHGILGEAMTASFFYAPNAVGTKNPELFERSEDPKETRREIPILAYLLTMLQVCLKEWRGGYHEKQELNAKYMLSLYICHYDGLVDSWPRAGPRLNVLYDDWVARAINISRAREVFKRKKYIQPITRAEDVREDTPGPSGFEEDTWAAPPTPGPSRVRRSPADRAARRPSPLGPSQPSTPLAGSPSRLDVPRVASPPSPAPELNAEGRYTTAAKGKGPAAQD